MKVAGFDSKPFYRGHKVRPHPVPPAEQYLGHHTQLGVGVVIPDMANFTDLFTSKFAKLKGEFEIDTELPFIPTNGLLKYGRRKAVAIADKLVTAVQDQIESIHCSYVALSTKMHPHVQVGGMASPSRSIDTRPFIDSLGPMFSYLTAQSYVYATKNVSDSTDIRIDSFVSKETRAWDDLASLNPKYIGRATNVTQA